jgi:uncharacterized protein
MDDLPEALLKPCTAFRGNYLLSSGPMVEVALAVKSAIEQGATETILAFDDATGSVVDFDLRGTKADVIARLSQPYVPAERPPKAPRKSTVTAGSQADSRGRGRPKLGVIAREVTLLPRHWEWLATQPGGASVALRKLVDDARRLHGGRDRTRQQQERAYHFMSALAGDLPGFEEATRALFAHDAARFDACIAAWPRDVREHAAWLASADDAPGA